ncbi:hypothetical protein WJX72_006868 [[Myrmecia] bisecta]|uniref:Uncharacterized protein n=1 Tax=[Myrmecia] bisecta TaxID=41462 RepID=A0AAW1PX84_9CHLO
MQVQRQPYNRYKRPPDRSLITTAAAAGSRLPYVSSPSAGRARSLLERWRQSLISAMPFLGSKELLQRIGYTCFLIALARIGAFIPIPEIDPGFLPQSFVGDPMAELFGEGLELPANILMLGLGPFINASILVSLFSSVKDFPGNKHLRELAKDGRVGQAAIRGIISWLATAFAAYMGATKSIELLPFALVKKQFITLTMLTLMAGSCILSWISDEVERAGLGDGVSLIICLGILGNYAKVVEHAATVLAANKVSIWTLLQAALGYVVLVLASVYATRIELRLPLIYYKARKSKSFSASIRGGEAAMDRKRSRTAPDSDYLPIRINPNGMTPLLLASFLFYGVPSVVGAFSPTAGAVLGAWYNAPSFPFAYGVVVFLGEFVDLGGGSAKSISDYLSVYQAGIKSVSPGEATEKYLNRLGRQTRTWGGVLVASLAVAALLFDRLCTKHIGTSLGSLNLLLIVGFITSTLRQVSSLVQLPALERTLQRERDILQTMSASGERPPEGDTEAQQPQLLGTGL